MTNFAELDTAAGHFMGSLLSLLPCEDCQGWARGFTLNFRVNREEDHYVMIMGRVEEPLDEEEDVGYEQYETASMHLGRFLDGLRVAGMMLRRFHYGEYGIFDILVEDTISDFRFTLFVTTDEEGRGLPEGVFEETEEITPGEFGDLHQGLPVIRQLAQKFRKALRSVPPLTTAEVIAGEMQRFDLPSTAMTHPELLKLILAAIGYKYQPSRVLKMSPEERGELTNWALNQLGTLRCLMLPRKVVLPDRWKGALLPLANTGS